MQSKLLWTIAALATLGGPAFANNNNKEDPPKRVVCVDSPKADMAETMVIGGRGGGSHRGVAQDYLVAPHGGELTGQMRFVTSEPARGGGKLKFSDLALFTVGGRWSLVSKLGISGSATFLPKQPSFTDEKPWQSVGMSLRSPLGKRVALALSGGGGHLIDHAGMWTREAMTIEWRKPIADELTFDVTGSIGGVTLSAPRSNANAGPTSAFITEIAVSTSALFHIEGKWGAWAGIGYALPVSARGIDPTTDLRVDPQPRLDFRVGTVFSLERKWDLFAEYAIIDRGDMSDPSTRLPILDGGFDQHQIMMGVTRHIQDSSKRRRDRDDDAMRIGTR
jgi:hypothetical protein